MPLLKSSFGDIFFAPATGTMIGDGKSVLVRLGWPFGRDWFTKGKIEHGDRDHARDHQFW